MPQSKYWNLAGQSVAIVASILMAFAIQAWWDERQDRQVIESALRSMYDDFGKNVSIIDAVLQVHREIKDASEFVMAHTGPEPIKDVDNSKLAQSILKLTYRPILRPVTGSLDSLINSGRWELLERGELLSQTCTMAHTGWQS
ncbi:MAG: hypothetical protein E2O61_01320 [Gammaproteobacteria bacterium]|nr:MAG: hypothetical protein E2O61_01320 [Gammaproteobacteria bacterium]